MKDSAEPDWRLQGQEQYLAGVELTWRRYRRYEKNPDWDHDHCEFCGAKFMVDVVPDILNAGYCTLDGYSWICESCFEDFRDRFQWKLILSSGDA